jgi:hypothetical protein
MKKLKKVVIIGFTVAVTIAAVLGSYLILADAKAKAELKKESVQKMIKELERERKKIDQERLLLDQLKSSLKSYEIELSQKNQNYLADSKKLKGQKEEFQKKVDAKVIDKQIIETYENIDPAQSARLILNLYKKDANLTTLLLRRLSGRKAGKILEQMIVLNPETAALLAKKTLETYKPR